ncbi:MAG TPA: AsmA-like C-terminal region-containing protein [Opitutaceae bacterium]|jgi:hypothetical protein|nr:AsmA-like C-terminal region-containing protein [Opitutaceae bacterium]
MSVVRHLSRLGQVCLHAVATLALWTFWLALALLLALQAYLAASSQLEVPGFVLRAFESRLAQSGMQASFGRTRFDPSGRVLVQDLRVTLPNFSEPLVTARAVDMQLDLWALSLDRFEATQVRIIGGSLRVPAMFSPTGKADEVVHDLEADLRPRGTELDLASLSFHLGTVPVTAHGTLHLAGARANATQLPLADFLARNYGTFSRKFAALVAQADALENPVVQAEFIPSESHGADVDVEVCASALRWARPAIQASQLRLLGRVPLLNSEPVPLEIRASAASLRLPDNAGEVRQPRLRLEADLAPNALAPAWRSVEVAASAVRLRAFSLEIPAPFARVRPASDGTLLVDAGARPWGAPLAAEASVDLAQRSAYVRLHGKLAPDFLATLGTRTKRDPHRYVALASAVDLDARARFGPGWKFERAEADAYARGVSLQFRPNDPGGYVKADEAGAHAVFDGKRLHASDAFLRIGDDYARGSYEEDMASRRYRFLLDGRLRPLDITPWFTDWWPKFFRPFDFSRRPAEASLDLSGQWPTDHETAVFIGVDARDAAYRGVPFDRARTRLFIRPNLVDDGLEAWAERGAGRAQGTFLARLNATGQVVRLDTDFTSTLDPAPLVRSWPEAPAVAAAFDFSRPPALALRGSFENPTGAKGGLHPDLRLDLKADAPLRYHGFPVDRLAFSAQVHGPDVTIGALSLGFADGAASGHAAVTGKGAAQRIRFDGSLQDASLPKAVDALQKFSARDGKGVAAITADAMQNLAGDRFDLTGSAEGANGDAFSYHGQGKAEIRGPDLAKVRLLGLLSSILPITTLHFTQARSDFTLQSAQLAFSDINITGANSRIEAHGSYALDRHTLDFYARIYPLKENKFLVGKLLSTVMTPLSYLSAVRLSGTLANPSWSLAALSPGAAGLAPGLAPGSAKNPPSQAAPSPLARPASP